MPTISLRDDQIGFIRGVLATAHVHGTNVDHILKALNTTVGGNVEIKGETIVEVDAGTMVWVRGLGSVCMAEPDGDAIAQNQASVYINTEDAADRYQYDLESGNKGDGYPILSVEVNDFMAYDDRGPYVDGDTLKEYTVTETRAYTVRVPEDCPSEILPGEIAKEIARIAPPIGETFRVKEQGTTDRHIEAADGTVIA